MSSCFIVTYVKGDVRILERVFSTLRGAENYIMSEVRDGYGPSMGVKCYLNNSPYLDREYWAAEEEADLDHPHYIVTEKAIDDWEE